MAQGMQKIQRQLPAPSRVPARTSDLMNLILLSARGQHKATFSPYLGFRSFVGSVKTAAEESLDTTAASWIRRVTDFFKGKKWFNHFLIFPSVKRVFSFVPSGQGLHSSSTQDKLLLVVHPEDQKQNWGRTTQTHGAQTARHIWGERWPNGTFTYVTGN